METLERELASLPRFGASSDEPVSAEPAPSQPPQPYSQAVESPSTTKSAAAAAGVPEGGGTGAPTPAPATPPFARPVTTTAVAPPSPALIITPTSVPSSPATTTSTALAPTVPSSPAAVAPPISTAAAMPSTHHTRRAAWTVDSRRVLIIGEAGVGKSTLASALLASVDPSAGPPSTPRTRLDSAGGADAWAAWASRPTAWEGSATARDADSRTLIRLTVLDTPGWDPSAPADAPCGGIQAVAAALCKTTREAYETALRSELSQPGAGVAAQTPAPPPLFTAALLLLPPHRPPTAGERALASALERTVPVIPVLAKADAYTPAELADARAAVSAALGAKTSSPLLSEASLASARAGRGSPPFAVIGGSACRDDPSSAGAVSTAEPVRSYAWGCASAADAAVSDTPALATVLVDAPDLPAAVGAQYAGFRAASLRGGGGGGGGEAAAVPLEEVEGGGRRAASTPRGARARARAHPGWLDAASGALALAAAALVGAAVAAPEATVSRTKRVLGRAKAKSAAATHGAGAAVAGRAEAAADTFLSRAAAAKERAAAAKAREEALAAAARGDVPQKKKRGLWIWE